MQEDVTQDQKIKELEEKCTELENNWKRALADYRNLQKRTEEEKESLVSFISALILKRVLPVLDNLEMLEKHLNDEGVRLVIKDFKQILNEEGVIEVNALNQKFDATTMEAIEIVEGEQDKVIEVLNRGYMYKKVGANAQKLLRPARVKVGAQKKEEKQ